MARTRTVARKARTTTAARTRTSKKTGKTAHRKAAKGTGKSIGRAVAKAIVKKKIRRTATTPIARGAAMASRSDGRTTARVSRSGRTGRAASARVAKRSESSKVAEPRNRTAGRDEASPMFRNGQRKTNGQIQIEVTDRRSDLRHDRRMGRREARQKLQRQRQHEHELGGSANMLAETTLASRTAGKHVLKPQAIPLSSEIPSRSRLSGKGFAQMASTTRTANEDPNSLGRGNTDFTRISGKRA